MGGIKQCLKAWKERRKKSLRRYASCFFPQRQVHPEIEVGRTSASYMMDIAPWHKVVDIMPETRTSRRTITRANIPDFYFETDIERSCTHLRNYNIVDKDAHVLPELSDSFFKQHFSREDSLSPPVALLLFEPWDTIYPHFVNPSLKEHLRVADENAYGHVLKDILRYDPLMDMIFRRALLDLMLGNPITGMCVYSPGITSVLRVLRITPCFFKTDSKRMHGLFLEYNMPYEPTDIVPNLMRNFLLLSSIPSLLSLVDLSGKVLYQNFASILFFGDLYSGKHDTQIPNFTSYLFAQAQESYQNMIHTLACESGTCMDGDWEGVIKLRKPDFGDTDDLSYLCAYPSWLSLMRKETRIRVKSRYSMYDNHHRFSSFEHPPSREAPIQDRKFFVHEILRQFARPHNAARHSHLDESQSDVSDSEMVYHHVRVIPVFDPVVNKDVFLIIQNDVTQMVRLENDILTAAENQLHIMERLFPVHVIKHFLKDSIRSPLSFDAYHTLAQTHDHVVVLFADISGFTRMSDHVSSTHVLHFLNGLYNVFDRLSLMHHAYNLDIVGDCYICVLGLFEHNYKKDDVELGSGFQYMISKEDAARDVPRYALDGLALGKRMIQEAQTLEMPDTLSPVQIRVGLHYGPLVSGIIGSRIPKFTLFGDTMNFASRMESTGVPGYVQTSHVFAKLLPHHIITGNDVQKRDLDIKGKGQVTTYLFL